jgi:hypothetical protein
MGRRCKENKLLFRWDRKQRDFLFYYPRSCDGALVHYTMTGKSQHIPIGNYNMLAGDAIVWEPSFLEELEKRGYDLTTLRFEVSLKEDNNDDSGTAEGENS